VRKRAWRILEKSLSHVSYSPFSLRETERLSLRNTNNRENLNKGLTIAIKSEITDLLKDLTEKAKNQL